MRSFLAVLGIAFVLAVTGPAGCTDEPERQETQETATKTPMKQPEILHERPSGFWTSNRPAVGGAYRWRLLGIGCVLAIGTGYAMWRLIKKANAERARRDAGIARAVARTKPEA